MNPLAPNPKPPASNPAPPVPTPQRTPPAPPPAPRRPPTLFLPALLLAVFLAYQPAWQGGLIWDDDAHVTRPELRSWDGLYRIWFDVRATVQYYPLAHSVFWLEHKLWGDATLGYHLVNIFLHGTAALMVWLILRRLAIPGACLAAAIFALHPVQVESVAWITELKNTLSAVFYLSAAMLYLRFDQTRKISWYLAALGVFLMALASKTVTGTLPGALLVIFWWQRGRLSWKKDVVPLVPFFLLGAGMGMLTAWWELEVNKCIGPEFDLTPVQRMLIAGRAVWFDLGKLLWPANLTFIYPRWQIDSHVWWQYLFPFAAATLLAATWAMRRWTRAPLAAVLFFGGSLVPVIGFFNLYTFQYSFVADHYQYLASLGIITWFSAGLTWLLTDARGWLKVIGHIGCLSLLLLLAVLSWRQSRIYANIETLYQTTIERNPNCWMAHYNLGVVLADRGQVDKAIDYYQKTLEIKPDHAEAHNNLGNALVGRGQIEEAIAHYQMALKIKPDHVEARNDLGAALALRGRYDEAIAHIRKALEIKPGYVDARRNLEIVLALQGGVRTGLAQRRELLRSRPKDATLLSDIARLLATDPNASVRNGAEAVEFAQRAVQFSDGKRPEILDALAAAYAEAGRFAEAVQTARKALDLAAQQGKPALVQSILPKIWLYEAGKPFHEEGRRD